MADASQSFTKPVDDRRSRANGHGPDVITPALAYAWAQQRIWSETANRLKHGLEAARRAALVLGIAAAILAVAAVQLAGVSSAAGRVLGLLAGVAAGLAPAFQRRAGTRQVAAWTRARSASEGLKSEVYEYLAGGSAYTGADRDQQLGSRSRAILGGVSDLLRHAAGIQPDSKPLPDVSGVDSYLAQRVNPQIDRYYKPKAARYQKLASRLRLAGEILGGIAVLLGAAAASFGARTVVDWVPVVTTVAASLTAFIAASRYDHQIVEFLRTAQQLEYLRDSRVEAAMTDSDFIDACEDVISIENQGWMTNWAKSE
jgi:SMODS and SLOG-associating 2TM effector domain 1/Protein of unknown function (DUF4231)